MDTFATVNFTTHITDRIGNYSEIYSCEDKPKPYIRKKARGFCLNQSCKSRSDVYKINDKHYRKNYSTDNYRTDDCPDCSQALFWTRKWELIEGFLDKDFKYRERPQLCK